MRLLCDTQIVIWAVAGSADLSARARALVVDPANEILFSTASLWEIAIKIRVGKLKADGDEIHDECLSIGMLRLDIEVSHLAAVARMADALHNDPFDHLLIAQAIAEGVPFLTADRVVQRYPVEIVKA